MVANSISSQLHSSIYDLAMLFYRLLPELYSLELAARVASAHSETVGKSHGQQILLFPSSVFPFMTQLRYFINYYLNFTPWNRQVMCQMLILKESERVTVVADSIISQLRIPIYDLANAILSSLWLGMHRSCGTVSSMEKGHEQPILLFPSYLLPSHNLLMLFYHLLPDLYRLEYNRQVLQQLLQYGKRHRWPILLSRTCFQVS